MTRTDKFLSAILFALCMYTVVLSVRYINKQNKWSPIDEYAHFDYVEKLLIGRLPRLSDPISEEIYQHIKNNPAQSVSGVSQTREELGLGNFSYQAKHPPLYFMVLSVPEFVLQKMDIDVFRRLQILRIFSYFIFVAGMFMCIPVFNALRRLGFQIPLFYSLGCVLFGLLIFVHERYGLGNNALSPLLINCAVLFMLNYRLKPENRSLYLFLIFCGLSLLAALTNIFIVPFLCLFILKKYKANFSWRNFLLAMIPPLLTAGAALVWKSCSEPDPDFEAFIQTVLAMTIPAGVLNYTQFLNLLTEDTFTINIIGNHFTITRIMIYLFLFSTIFCGFYYRQVWYRHRWLIYSTVLLIAFAGITFVANKYVPRVTWVAFRHYLGFIPVLYVSCTGFILVLYTKYLTK